MSPFSLERAAGQDWEETARNLPEVLRHHLVIEKGKVHTMRHSDDAFPLFSRSYRMAACRGIVLGIHSNDDQAFDSPWTGIVGPEAIGASLPVILSPSAVLALVSYALEATGDHVKARTQEEVPGITVLDTATSPYPPQHHPFTQDGSFSPDRLLIEEGRWCNREEHAGDAVDPLFYLLTRPERALRPLAAATHFDRRNLAVRCSREVVPPSPAVVIDSWRVRVGARSGAVPFHAELSCSGRDGERLAVSQPVVLELDPWWLLGRIEGASGPAAPAVDEDPVEGHSYGSASTLVTSVALADLLSRKSVA